MRKAQDGNAVAYARLLHQLVPLLRRVIGSRLRFLQEADRNDLIQEVLLSLHAARATYDPRRPFIPWLMAIAHYRMVDRAHRHTRLSAREVLVDEFIEVGSNEETYPSDEDYGNPGALRQAVKSLSISQRTAVELLTFRDLSLKEASNVSGISIGALRVSFHRAVKSLRKILT